MTPFESYWSKIICINRNCRTDRWSHVVEQCSRYGLQVPERFEAHEGTQLDGRFNGNYGCTSSHRGVLELIAHNHWSKTLVLEDDFEIVEPGRDHLKDRYEFHSQWDEIRPEIPNHWDMLYLGGHYGENPLGRISKHIIRIGRMLTTSSYGITDRMARIMAPHIYGNGPIDSLYGHFNVNYACYCVQPRLMVQYENESDLNHRMMDNSQCMLDGSHEAMV